MLDLGLRMYRVADAKIDLHGLLNVGEPVAHIVRDNGCALPVGAPTSFNFDVATQESNQPSLVNSASRKFEDHLRRRFFARSKPVAVEFEEQDTDNEACTLIAIDEGMVLHEAGHVLCGKLDDVRAFICKMVLL